MGKLFGVSPHTSGPQEPAEVPGLALYSEAGETLEPLESLLLFVLNYCGYVSFSGSLIYIFIYFL